MKKHPIQPLEEVNGFFRFKENKIVKYLLENGGIDLNQIACLGFDREDRVQFAQLIGYSLSGWSELSYVSNDDYAAAHLMKDGKDEKDARIESLETTLSNIREHLKNAAAEAFHIHPEDLHP